MAKVVKKKSNALQSGDIIDVIAPGFACALEDVEKVRIFLEEKGFKPRIPKDIIEDHPLFSNRDEKRIQMLIRAIKAKDSKAIWCLRGGYGSNHLLPALKKIKKQSPKLMIGISDITSLHGFLIQNWNWKGLHGPLLDRLGKGQVPKAVEEELMEVLHGDLPEVIFKDLIPMNKKAQSKKKIMASVIGGNLKVVEGHVGTKDAFNFSVVFKKYFYNR